MQCRRDPEIHRSGDEQLRDYGFHELSFIITETHPHGGPPLHTHETEGAHVVLAGTMEYVIGDKRFTVTAPYIARVPAGVARTFVNAGTTPLNIIAVFPTPDFDWTPISPNPDVVSISGGRHSCARS